MEIKVLGSGCAKCNTLVESVKSVVAENGLEATISKVEDIVEIMKFGVTATPALVVDGEVVVKGKLPTPAEIKEYLTK